MEQEAKSQLSREVAGNLGSPSSLSIPKLSDKEENRRTAAGVLLAIAQELAEKAQNALPKLKDDETVITAWLKDGVYYVKSAMNGEIFLRSHSFREGGVSIRKIHA